MTVNEVRHIILPVRESWRAGGVSIRGEARMGCASRNGSTSGSAHYRSRGRDNSELAR